LLALCTITFGTAWAQALAEKTLPVTAASPDKSQNTKAVKTAVITKPLWEDLKPEQKSTLAPLQAVWLKMSEAQKRKWLEVSKNYDKFSVVDKAKLQDRMRDWAKLSPEQRAQARINFSQAKKLSSEEKQKQWQAYQALSPEEKQKLQSKAKSATPNSAALAAKPQNKVVPLAKQSPAPAAK
jgi:hypothetical protein